MFSYIEQIEKEAIKQMRKHKITETHPQRWNRQIEVPIGNVSHCGFQEDHSQEKWKYKTINH